MMRTGVGLVCVGGAGLLLLAGVGFCLWALLQWLATMVGMPLAALLVGVLLFAISGGLIWVAIRLNR
jgi:hypothetical protein